MTTIGNLCVIQTGNNRRVLSLTEPLAVTPLPGEETHIFTLVFNGTADVCVTLKEPGAVCHLNGIYLVHDTHQATLRFRVHHLTRETTSHQIVRGLAGGTAQADFTGRIQIAPGADNAIGTQNHRGILLDETAHILARPELEIDTDAVTCSHGSAIGDFDKESLFYLQARGLNERTAKHLMIQSFLFEITAPEFAPFIKEWMNRYV